MEKKAVDSVLERYNAKRTTKTKSKDHCSRTTANLIVKHGLMSSANPLQSYRDLRRERVNGLRKNKQRSAVKKGGK